MATVKASVTWPGPHIDVVRVFVEPTPMPWGTEVHDEDVVVFRALDDREKPMGDIAGIEIVGFLDFDRWQDLPKLDLLWQLPGWEPLPLNDLLRRKQKELRQQALASAKAR